MSSRQESILRHPSQRRQHHMATWPLRAALRHGIRRMERVCSHGVGHPDPDWCAVSPDASTLHRCDGCCQHRVTTPVGRFTNS
jgi:hypothetical protein